MRVFRFATGKLSRTYDESLAAANELQRSGSGEPGVSLRWRRPCAPCLQGWPNDCGGRRAAKPRASSPPNLPRSPPNLHARIPTPPTQAELHRLDAIDYGRRVAIEKELAADPGGCLPAWLAGQGAGRARAQAAARVVTGRPRGRSGCSGARARCGVRRRPRQLPA